MPRRARLLGNGRSRSSCGRRARGSPPWNGLALTHFSADRTIDGGDLVVRLPEDGTVYQVAVENPTGRAERVVSYTVDGRACAPHRNAARVRLRAMAGRTPSW